MRERHHFDGQQLLAQLRAWAHELGFSQIGVADVDLARRRAGPARLAGRGLPRLDGLHGSATALKRARPAELVPGTVSVITARMDYLPRGTRAAAGRRWSGSACASPQQAAVSVYARGRDYHKVLRTRLQTLADRLARRGRPVRPPRLHRFGAGARGRTGRAQRPGLARQAHAGAAARRRARCSSWARSSSTWRCRPRRRSARIAAAAAPASTSARRRPSSRPTGSTRGAASPT